MKKINSSRSWLYPLLVFCTLFKVSGVFAHVDDQINLELSPVIIGEAYIDGELDYREWHFSNMKGGIEKVLYVDNSDTPFAEKVFDGGSDLTPGVVYRDFRSGHFYQAKFQTGSLLLGFQKNTDSELQKTRITSKQPLVIDAGFDAFIRSRWQLLEDSVQSFYYAFPSRQRLIELRVKKVEVSQCQGQGIERCYLVSPESWLLRILAEDLLLGYDDMKRLVVFSGISNVVGVDGSALRVDIFYRYVLD